MSGDADSRSCGPGPGYYAKKQIFCKSAIIAWSHRSRFKLARRLVEPYAGRKLLDYGCGDGTFLAEVHDLFPIALGGDIDPKQTVDCSTRLAGLSNLSFVLIGDLGSTAHESAYDVVTCMEVLEHCLNGDLEKVLTDLRWLVSPSGVVIVSVPVEIGPTLVGKQLLRRFAGWRGLGDYKFAERYSSSDLWRMVFAGEQTAIHRPVYYSQNGERLVGHKGFNWRTLRMRLREHFNIKQTSFSPLGWLGGYVSSQAWFICEPRWIASPRGERSARSAG